MRVEITILLAISLAGCATVTRGTSEQITFTSEPPEAEVTTSIGLRCNATPCTFDIPRKQEFIATFKKDGFLAQDIEVKSGVGGAGAAGFAGNVLIGGIIGMGVDAATGATMEHHPNPVHAELEMLPPAVKAPLPKKPLRIPMKGAGVS